MNGERIQAQEELIGAPADGRIRVLWLIKGLGRGGSESLLANAARVIDREAFFYQAAYLLPRKNALVGDLRAAGVPVHLLPARNEFDLRWAMRLRRLIRSELVDIVHVHSAYVAGIARLAIRSMPRKVRPRIVTTEHVTWNGYPRLTRALNAATFGLDDGKIAVSNAVLGSIPPRMRGRVHPVNHGIPLARVRPELAHRDSARREFGVGDGEILVGTVANFREQKGYRHLLHAAQSLIDQGLPIRFLAVGGPGADEHRIRAVHETLRLGDRFLLLGVREDAARILAACDIFVLASLWEGLPLVVMEAMALGIPVVATAVGGVPELVRHGATGLLVAPGSPSALAEGIASLARDSGRRDAMGRAAAEDATRFDNAQGVRFIESLYRELMDGRTDPTSPTLEGSRP